MTTFICNLGTYLLQVISFVFMNASSIFQRLMYQLLGDVPFFRLFLDYVVDFSATLGHHLEHMQFVLKMVSDHSLNI